MKTKKITKKLYHKNIKLIININYCLKIKKYLKIKIVTKLN